LLARTADERPGSLALGALVFGAGIGALATEITASRLLAPYFGSSTIVWANLIGIVLAALALGYWLGGRIADRRPFPSLLGSIVLAAAVCVAAIPFVAKPFLDLTVEGLDSASAGAVIGSFLAVLMLCAPPVVLLGMVSPFAIRLAVSSIETAGTVAGRLYALSTAGSLLGTFLPALVLIPAVGTQRTFVAIAAVLAASSCFLLGARYLVVAVALAALVAVPPGAAATRRSPAAPTNSQPTTSIASSSSPPAAPSVHGVAENALARCQPRSLSSGRGAGTTPVGNPTPTANPSYDPRSVAVNNAFPPSTALDVHGRGSPDGPALQARWLMAAGAVTVADARRMGTGQCTPTAYQYSSSWSSKPSRAPRTR